MEVPEKPAGKMAPVAGSGSGTGLEMGKRFVAEGTLVFSNQSVGLLPTPLTYLP